MFNWARSAQKHQKTCLNGREAPQNTKKTCLNGREVPNFFENPLFKTGSGGFILGRVVFWGKTPGQVVFGSGGSETLNEDPIV